MFVGRVLQVNGGRARCFAALAAAAMCLVSVFAGGDDAVSRQKVGPFTGPRGAYLSPTQHSSSYFAVVSPGKLKLQDPKLLDTYKPPLGSGITKANPEFSVEQAGDYLLAIENERWFYTRGAVLAPVVLTGAFLESYFKIGL